MGSKSVDLTNPGPKIFRRKKKILESPKMQILNLLVASKYLHSIYIVLGIMWRRQWHPTPVLLPGKSHGWRSLEGCSPWGRWGLDTTEWLHFHFSLSWIGEGNGNPLQCYCLENPRDRGAWWAAIYGVAQSRTLLKQLSSSGSSIKLRNSAFYVWKWSCSVESDSLRPHGL